MYETTSVVSFTFMQLKDGAYIEQGSSMLTLLVATGFHRPTSSDELEAKLGKEVMSEVEGIVIHDCRNTESNVKVGILPSVARE